MAIVHWDPFREMEDLLDKYSRTPIKSLLRKRDDGLLSSDWMPTMDIKENKDSYLIKAELPGVEKENVNISIEDGVLTIKGEKKTEKEEKDDKTHRVECSYGSFFRSFTLPREVKSDQIEASYKDGILKLKIPKSEESKPKQIEVKIK
ncbi:MAG: Hsp20/alpha crystallin family protein [Spirochaetia bacterium]|nr:Hsp20/alpha crystallin family protein [Spirochaetia bacterium]